MLYMGHSLFCEGGAGCCDVDSCGVRSQKRRSPRWTQLLGMGVLKADAPEETIQVSGDAHVEPVSSFADFLGSCKHADKLLANIHESGFTTPTTIQQYAMPCALDGTDMYAIAPTGSGKTLAFLLPGMLLSLKAEAATKQQGPTVVVLSPTRELAAQSHRALKLLLPGTTLRGSLLCKATIAGTDFSRVDLLIATPLLLVQSIQSAKVDLSHVRLLVLDEADKVLEAGKGFIEQVDAIYAACAASSGLSTGLFSATLPPWVDEVASSVMHSPTSIMVGAKNVSSLNVEQSLLFVGQEKGKLLELRQMLAGGLAPPVLVFVSSKERAKALCRELMYEGAHVDAIHGDQSHAARAAAIANFRKGKTWVLITTDLLARGMDFLGVRAVINYDFPRTKTDYIHRVGRTGRAGRRGRAVTFFVEDDAPRLQAIADCMRRAGCPVPEWMLLLQRGRSRRSTAQHGVDEGIATESEFDRRRRERRKQLVQQSKAKKQKLAGKGIGDKHGAS
eukprot:jgi/Ulvmu1/10366/UM061_0049.1